MRERVELHFHLLPGVDDGPGTMAEAMELARATVADGTAVVACTPHIRDVGDVRELPDRVRELEERLARERVPLEVLCAGELAWDDVAGLSQAELEIVALGPTGARWLLLEAPLFDPCVAELRAAAEELRARGYGVLIGHPERCKWLWDPGEDALAREEAAGSPLQVNGSSLTGRHGADARERALALVRAGRVTVIASDAHRPARGPVLTAAVDALERVGVSGADAERLTAEGPRHLLERGIPLPRAAGAGAGAAD